MNDICRKKIIFEGRVQRVGFRCEIGLLASRLGLAGYARNLLNGDVEAELQGDKDKIYFLIETLRSIPRIIITNYTVKNIPVIEDDKTFTIKP